MDYNTVLNFQLFKNSSFRSTHSLGAPHFSNDLEFTRFLCLNFMLNFGHLTTFFFTLQFAGFGPKQRQF